MTRIAIDYTPAYEQGAGIGRYVRELVNALATIGQQHDYRLFVSGAKKTDLPATPDSNFRWCNTRISPKWLARGWHRLQLPIPVETITGEIDLFHATDFVLPPTRPNTKTIVTVHDLSYLRVPEAASPRLQAYLEYVVPSSVHQATHILADSQATKDDLISAYHLPDDKITVLLSGVGAAFRPTPGQRETLNEKYNLPPAPYLFTAGTIQPRKNYIRLMKVLARLREQGFEHHLVIAGGKGWLADPLYETINSLKINDYVHLIGFANDADLPALYTEASCVVFPSLYEGFGFPVLEGMACGAPVVTSNLSSLPEVGGDAALLVDPYNVDAIYNAVESVLVSADLRDQRIAKGFKQVAQFTWENAAHNLLGIYETVLML